MRTAAITRKTAETDVRLTLGLDGTGESNVATGCGFLDHMLTLFARHGRGALTVSGPGDPQVDDHHTVEDIGIALGQALREALGDLRGVKRYGDALLPMTRRWRWSRWT
jgi:imidazoleglycerol-phosphate dehydratase